MTTILNENLPSVDHINVTDDGRVYIGLSNSQVVQVSQAQAVRISTDSAEALRFLRSNAT